MNETEHKFVGFSHCLACAKHAYVNDMKELRAENERLKAELATTEQELGKHHFAFLSELKKLEQENAALKEENAFLKESLS